MIDFSKVVVAKIANPRTEPKVQKEKPAAPYTITVDYADSQITFQKPIFDELDLTNNSLSSGTLPDLPEDVILIVNPGNTGKFMKRAENSAKKGKKCKNIVLVKELSDKGFTSGKLNLEFLGQDDKNLRYYKFIQYIPTDGEEESYPDGPGDDAAETVAQ